jgi:hypothetical protein
MGTHTLVMILAFGGSFLSARGSREVRRTVVPDLRLPAAVCLKAVCFAPTETVQQLDFVHIPPLGTGRHALGWTRMSRNGAEAEEGWRKVKTRNSRA